MKTIKTERDYKALTSYFDVKIIKVSDGFCIVKLLGKKK